MGHGHRRRRASSAGGSRHAARGRAGAVRLAAGIAMLALVSITGHYGGNLTHGTTFLGEYAPSFLRSLIGAAPRRPPRDERRRRRPVSRRRAAAARAALRHVPQRRQARRRLQHRQLRLDARRRRHGPRHRARQPRSERAHLSHRLAARRRSVHAGRGQDAADGRASRDPALVGRRRCAARYDRRRDRRARPTSSRCSRPSSGSAAQRRRPPPLPAAPRPIRSSSPTCSQPGLLVRQVSQSDARLVVSVNSPGTALSAAALAALNAAAAEIVDLNLADTALDDAGLAAIGELAAATHLRLARNRLTDGGLAVARGAAAAHAPEPLRQQRHHRCRARVTGGERLAARALRVADRRLGRRRRAAACATPRARRGLRRGVDGRRTLSGAAGALSAAAARCPRPTAA